MSRIHIFPPVENLPWQELATYNAERARGIVHTPEWDAKMAKDQERFDSYMKAAANRQRMMVMDKGETFKRRGRIWRFFHGFW